MLKQFLIALAFFISGNSFAADTIKANVVKVLTGDTIIVKQNNDQFPVRLASIDAPELEQPYGQDSKAMLMESLLGNEVTIILVGRDYKKMKVGFVFLGQLNINYMMVATGHAWALRTKSRGVNYSEAELNARKDKQGIWSQDKQNIKKPWIWAKNNEN